MDLRRGGEPVRQAMGHWRRSGRPRTEREMRNSGSVTPSRLSQRTRYTCARSSQPYRAGAPCGPPHVVPPRTQRRPPPMYMHTPNDSLKASARAWNVSAPIGASRPGYANGPFAPGRMAAHGARNAKFRLGYAPDTKRTQAMEECADAVSVQGHCAHLWRERASSP